MAEDNAYAVENIPKLEEYVSSTLKSDKYDIDNYVSLLRLYQVLVYWLNSKYYPKTLKVENVLNILAKTLTKLPERQFLTCTYLLTDKVVSITYDS